LLIIVSINSSFFNLDNGFLIPSLLISSLSSGTVFNKSCRLSSIVEDATEATDALGEFD
jgi:hypothetical protein